MTDEASHLDEEISDTPTLSCSRCGREWDLAYELDDLQVGNQALEQFALDHHRHTGHFPDDVTPWIADCRKCPETEQYLSAGPAKRFAEIHARHTGHIVEIQSPDAECKAVQPEDVRL